MPSSTRILTLKVFGISELLTSELEAGFSGFCLMQEWPYLLQFFILFYDKQGLHNM